MKEIDFLPEWYRSSKRRQSGYRLQYAVLGGVFLAMLMWNFFTIGSVSRAQAELAAMGDRVTGAQRISQEFDRLNSLKSALRKKADVLSEIDSRINLGSVIAEISFLVGDRLALSSVEFTVEKFADSAGSGSSSVRAVSARGTSKGGGFFGDVRFKVAISGVAADSGDVAAFICRLEDSEYFCEVVPGYSRNKQVKSSKDGDSGPVVVSEFQISCYLANYRQTSVRQ
jgi:hypothetical protein